MKRLSVVIIMVLLAGMLPAFALGGSNENEYLRGVWLSSVKNLDFPSKPGLSKKELERELDDVVSTCESGGINAIFFQVRPCADALYKSEIFPWSAVLSGEQGKAPDGDFDPLAYLIKKAHARGIEVHAWLNPYRIGKEEGGADSVINSLADSNPAKKHPEYYTVCSDGGVYFNPALPQVRQLIISGVEEIVSGYDVDGIHFDDYFYPYGVSDYPDSEEYETYGAEFSDIADFRRNNVNMLISDVSAAVHKIKPNVRFGVSPFGIWDNKKDNPDGSDTRGMSSYRSIFADSKAWVENGWVDYICPQLYWAFETPAAPFDKLVAWWSDLCGKSDVELYVGHALYKLGTGETGFDDVSQISRQLDLCRQSGVCGSVFFRYQTLKENVLGCFDLIKSYSFTVSQSSQGEALTGDGSFDEKAEKYINTAYTSDNTLRITSPQNNTRTSETNISISGVANPESVLTVNGERVPVTEHGYFSTYLPLEKGANTFIFKSGEETKSITVKRNSVESAHETVNGYFEPDSAFPSGDSFFYSGQQTQISVRALEGLPVFAEFMGGEIELFPQDDVSNGFVTYSANANVPNIMSGSSGGMPTRFYVKSQDGITEYGDAGESRVIGSPVTLYTVTECYVYNDTTNGGSMMDNYQLPVGACISALAYANGFYLMQSGKWINEADVTDTEPEMQDTDIDESKYTRVDLTFESVPTFQSRVTLGGTLVLSLYGVSAEPDVSRVSARVGVGFVCRGAVCDAVFTLESGAVEGFYVKKTDEKTISVWIYTNRRGGLSGKTIAIDPGHGGSDRGALGPAGEDGVCEDDLNLSVSYILAQKLREAGANVVLTRSDEQALPLVQRAGLIRSYTPDISISVHHNSVSQTSDFSKASGIVLLYSRETSLSLSRLVSDRITDGLDIPNNGFKAQSLKVCRDYRYPCILLECGFVCNPTEYEKLLTQEYKNKLCDNIVLSLTDYFR